MTGAPTSRRPKIDRMFGFIALVVPATVFGSAAIIGIVAASLRRQCSSRLAGLCS
jgi:hypothetical protein